MRFIQIDGNYINIDHIVSIENAKGHFNTVIRLSNGKNVYTSVTAKFAVEMIEMAEKAGLKKGDKYLKINGQDVTNLSAEEISNKIKGKKGQTFKLTIKRNNEEKEVSITTDKIEIPSINKETITKQGQKIGYITIKVFASNTDEQFKKALKELDKENINNLIIDLRNNQGGELNTVINIASNFLNKKQPIIQIETKNKKEIKYSTKNPEKAYKITVLINENSASASEVLAAALNE